MIERTDGLDNTAAAAVVAANGTLIENILKRCARKKIIEKKKIITKTDPPHTE
jgi:hypothetical protein